MAHSSLQNNLERSEFEARTRLGSQVETLQREVNLLKRKLESEEKHHKSIIETWEVRITDLRDLTFDFILTGACLEENSRVNVDQSHICTWFILIKRILQLLVKSKKYKSVGSRYSPIEVRFTQIPAGKCWLCNGVGGT